MQAHSTMNTEAHGETSGAILEEFFSGGGQFQQVRSKAMRRPGQGSVKQVPLRSLQTASEEKSGGGGGGGGGGDGSISSGSSSKRSAPKKNGTRRVRAVKTERVVKALHLEDRNVVSDLIHRVTQLSGWLVQAARMITEQQRNNLHTAHDVM